MARLWYLLLVPSLGLAGCGDGWEEFSVYPDGYGSESTTRAPGPARWLADFASTAGASPTASPAALLDLAEARRVCDTAGLKKVGGQ